MSRLLVCAFLFLGMLGNSAAAPDDSNPAGSVKVEPLPEPPTVTAQVRKSDLIVRAVVLRTYSYRIGSKVRYQARFRVLETLRGSVFYPLHEGDVFGVLYHMKPGVYGPHFMEPPDPGEYIVLLELRNVSVKAKIVGQDVEFIYPNPFALYEPSPEILQAVEARR